MSRHKNLMTRICFASVLSLGLAACGGKTVTPATPMAPTPVAPTPVVVTPVDPAAQMAAQDAAEAARTAADDAQMAADAVADLTGDGSAQAMVAQAAADAAMDGRNCCRRGLCQSAGGHRGRRCGGRADDRRD